jgi:rRNA maturation protein Nop10
MNCTDYTEMAYPTWVCDFCALENGGKIPSHAYTVHQDVCGICGKITTVTEPRDYSYPIFHH